MEENDLTRAQSEALVLLAKEANESLDAAASGAANRAFNLGCSVTLIPGLILTALVAIFTQLNWSAVAITLVLVVFAVVGFANLAAFTAAKSAAERAYQEDVSPHIKHTLAEAHIDRQLFIAAAGESLPASARLNRFLLQESQVLPGEIGKTA